MNVPPYAMPTTASRTAPVVMRSMGDISSTPKKSV
jgi:hypothetical protein